MKVVVVGASGLVGGNCYSFFKEKGVAVIGTHLSFPTENTIFFDATNIHNEANSEALNQIKGAKFLIYCGALTNVDYCENNEEESYNKTVISLKNTLEICKKGQCRVVYISTDYVFDGKKGPYHESDQTNPLNIYGKHKLLAEKEVLRQKSNNLIVRITNVYGNEIRDKNFISRLINNTLQDKTLKLPVDQFATPINAYDIASAIYVLISDNNEKRGIYHLGSTDYYNRYQLASKVISALKKNTIKIKPTNTDKLKQVAVRPKLGGLISCKFLNEYPNFQFSNVDDYLKNL